MQKKSSKWSVKFSVFGPFFSFKENSWRSSLIDPTFFEKQIELYSSPFLFNSRTAIAGAIIGRLFVFYFIKFLVTRDFPRSQK